MEGTREVRAFLKDTSLVTGGDEAQPEVEDEARGFTYFAMVFIIPSPTALSDAFRSLTFALPLLPTKQYRWKVFPPPFWLHVLLL